MCKMAKSLTGTKLNLHIFKNEKIFSKQDKPIDTIYQSANKAWTFSIIKWKSSFARLDKYIQNHTY